jgi:hypothetical protein
MRLLSFLLISSVAIFSCNQNDSSKTTTASEDGFSCIQRRQPWEEYQGTFLG